MTQLTDEQKEQLRQLRERHRMAAFAYKGDKPPQAVTDIDFLLSLLDSNSRAVAIEPHGDLTLAEEVAWRRERDEQMLRQMAAQGRWIESLRSQLNDAATRMRDKCVEKVKELHDEYESLECAAEAIALSRTVREIESLTLDPLEPGKTDEPKSHH